jgi:hypothetical protein
MTRGRRREWAGGSEGFPGEFEIRRRRERERFEEVVGLGQGRVVGIAPWVPCERSASRISLTGPDRLHGAGALTRANPERVAEKDHGSSSSVQPMASAAAATWRSSRWGSRSHSLTHASSWRVITVHKSHVNFHFVMKEWRMSWDEGMHIAWVMECWWRWLVWTGANYFCVRVPARCEGTRASKSAPVVAGLWSVADEFQMWPAHGFCAFLHGCYGHGCTRRSSGAWRIWNTIFVLIRTCEGLVSCVLNVFDNRINYLGVWKSVW